MNKNSKEHSGGGKNHKLHPYRGSVEQDRKRSYSGSGALARSKTSESPEPKQPTPYGIRRHSGGSGVAYTRIVPQQALDTYLSGGPIVPQGTIICKSGDYSAQQFFLGSDLTTFSVSSVENENLVYADFMRIHKCYDLVPTSTKVVVFDTQLNVKKAFFALVYNGVRAAPLWDSTKSEYVGMLTITDFMNILRKYHQSIEGVNQKLEDNKIADWKEVLKVQGREKPFISIDVNESLLDAVATLCRNKVHRLPVVNKNTGNVLYILTHKRILRFLYLYVYDLPRPGFVGKTPKELGIGTWNSICTVSPSTLLCDAFELFAKKRVSALPVVDEASGRVMDIYAKFDVINLAAEGAYSNLKVPIKDALKHRVDWFEGVHSSNVNDSLLTVVENLVKAEVHRMVIVNDQKQVEGIVSLSDVLQYLVLAQIEMSPPAEPMDTS